MARSRMMVGMTALSILGILLGVTLFLGNLTFSPYGPSGPYAFTYFFYTYLLPLFIVGISTIALVLSLIGKTIKGSVFILADGLVVLSFGLFLGAIDLCGGFEGPSCNFPQIIPFSLIGIGIVVSAGSLAWMAYSQFRHMKEV